MIVTLKTGATFDIPESALPTEPHPLVASLLEYRKARRRSTLVCYSIALATMIVLAAIALA